MADLTGSEDDLGLHVFIRKLPEAVNQLPDSMRRISKAIRQLRMVAGIVGGILAMMGKGKIAALLIGTQVAGVYLPPFLLAGKANCGRVIRFRRRAWAIARRW